MCIIALLNTEVNGLTRLVPIDKIEGNAGINSRVPVPTRTFSIRRHPLMTKLHGIKSSDPLVAQLIAEQVFDNALVAAGLMDDSRVMLPR